MAQPFIHLRARSAYSLLQSALHVGDLAKLALANDMPAIGVADANNLFGALEFSDKAAGLGIQPIIGCALDVKHEGFGGVVALYAQNAAGYANLMQLSSAAFLDVGAHDAPHVKLEKLAAHTEGLIALSGGGEGVLTGLLEAGHADQARLLLQQLAALFADRFYVELSRHAEHAEANTEGALVDFAYDLGLPLVATNDIRFKTRRDHHAHDALTCIANSSYMGEEDRPRVSPEHYFKTAKEMAELFSDLPEAIENTAEIARRCAFRVEKRSPILPQFDTKRGRDEAAELKAQAEAGLKARIKALGDKLSAPEEEYWKRLEFELGVITQMKFPGYFLIVSDFIKWAKSNDIPVGPGRGSGAGSLVAYSLTITDLDPLRFGLLFERFLNPERVSMPDFDIDFCQERRGEVIEYVKNKYGADRVAQIITFGTLQARAVLRDVGRVMQLPFGQVDKLAKLVPANPANPVTLAEAIKVEPKLEEAKKNEPEVRELLSVALDLEGLYRNASTHAAGVVIGDRPLTDLVALYRDPRSDMPATQFNMKWVEAAGLVKFDFLGLKTLDVIDKAVKFIRARGEKIDLTDTAYDDERTYGLMQSGLTFGVFQLEGQGMRDTLRKVKPTCLEDVIALISLYRPGPMKNIDHFAAVKAGQEKLKAARAQGLDAEKIAEIENSIARPDYLYPTLKPILEETYGVIVYQEQVMQIAQVLSGYSLGEADLLRRAMGKKQPAEMAKQKTRFIDGAKANGVNENLAAHIFDLVEEFAGYGFNKSHAAAYAVVAYHTAFLKTHFPVDFLAASMSLDISNSDKLASFHQDARRIGEQVLPPDINKSEADFSVEQTEEGAVAVRYALGAVRNVGVAAMESVVAERKAKGPFKALYDFAERIDPKAVNRRQLENLAKAGAFDPLESDRARAFAAAETIAAYAARVAEERASAQTSLFGSEEPSARPAFPKPPSWSGQDKLDAERESVGFYLSGHPLSNFFIEAGDRYSSYADLLEEGEEMGQGVFAMAGVLRRVQYRPAMSGGTLAFVSFSDPTGDFEAMVMPEHVAAARERLEVGRAFVFRGRVRWRDGDMKLAADTFEPVEAAEARTTEDLRVILKEGAPLELLAQTLGALPKAGPGEARPLRLVLKLKDGREIELDTKRLAPAGPAARAALKAARGVERVI
ncbi:DNA polymerase III subunit alpha [Terricaulis sp.]|uniref:DNA polymerase III subunit alpha n=1 Tax=Terricaulis sp. TaxID=2768686 RepID=UPI003783C861